jgi:hypothetical protein
VTANGRRLAPRRLTIPALAALSAGCFMALASGPADASAAPSVINASLNDVSCTAANSCMAVGWFLGRIQGTSGYQNFTLAEKWNGSTWTVVPSPSPRLPGGGALFTSVSCTSGTSCVAVGQTQVFTEPGGFTVLHPLAESWNGTTWSIVPTPNLAHSGASLNGVSCTSPSACMAVGNEGAPKNSTLFTLAEQWNGTAWKFMPTPPPLTPGGTALATVSCTAPGSCMAAGYYGYNNGTGTSVTLAEQWNGTSWQQRTTPTPGRSGTLAGVACTAATACMSTGGHSVLTGNLVSATLAEQWNGTSWQQRTTPTPGRSGTLAGVACTAATACMSTGGHSVPTGNLVSATLAEQWNGTSWKVVPSPNSPGAGADGLNGVACPAAAACMAVGSGVDQTGESGFNVAEAWNGTSWSLLRTPNPGSTNDELRGVACATSSSCMAVGDFTGIGNEMTLAEAWNGTAWSVVTTPHP